MTILNPYPTDGGHAHLMTTDPNYPNASGEYKNQARCRLQDRILYEQISAAGDDLFDGSTHDWLMKHAVSNYLNRSPERKRHARDMVKAERQVRVVAQLANEARD
jgi:hypothetical protein